jgi:erythromycin esterase-like protein
MSDPFEDFPTEAAAALDDPAAVPRLARTFDESRQTVELIRRAAIPLDADDDVQFGKAFDSFGDARVVLLGEASHGTSEFYQARAAITRWLIEQRGFDFVAVEADWPDAAMLDRYVRHRGAPAQPFRAFQRFPTWMWRNQEVDAFTQWLADHNRFRPRDRRAGFHGLDLYNLSASMRAVIDYLEDRDPEIAKVARERYGCLTPWSHEPARYGRAALSRGYAMCEEGAVAMLRDVLASDLARSAGDGEAFLDAAMNAHLVQNAEAYYRVMYYGSEASWNLRIKQVRPSRADSYEILAHEAGRPLSLIDLRKGVHDEPRARLMAPRLERFIGVIYRPETELWSHYVECQLPEQFDAYVWFDETTAVTPLSLKPEAVERGAEETWPFGL